MDSEQGFRRWLRAVNRILRDRRESALDPNRNYYDAIDIFNRGYAPVNMANHIEALRATRQAKRNERKAK